MRMENTRTTRKRTEWTPYKTRPAGRPRLRWMDQVEEELKRMEIIGWRAKVEDRQVFENTQISNFMKICPVGAEFFHADGQTDRHNMTYKRYSKGLRSASSCVENMLNK